MTRRKKLFSMRKMKMRRQETPFPPLLFFKENIDYVVFMSRATRLCRWLAGRSVSFLLFTLFLRSWPRCSCPNALATSNMAPAHQQATWVAMYPVLFRVLGQIRSLCTFIGTPLRQSERAPAGARPLLMLQPNLR